MIFLHTVIMGIVEGITEFLPISSTAHLDIARTLLQIPSSDFVKSFEIIIQLGAILAVVVLYFKKICASSFLYFRNIAIAFIPTGMIGFVLYKIIKHFFLGNTILAASMLVLGGIIIVIYENKNTNKIDDNSLKTIEAMSVKELLIVGCAQALAVIPGVSRSGAVIISGRMLGLPKILIAEFSFLLAIPTMLAASVYDIYKSGFAFASGEWQTIGIGFIVSFIVALIVIKWLLGYIKKHSFAIFGWYRIALGILVLLFLT